MDIPRFSEERIREELALLGFYNVSRPRLLEIKANLDKLVQCGMSQKPASSKSYTSPGPRSYPTFSEEEIEQQLRVLGRDNIPQPRLREMKQDLDRLVQHVMSNRQAGSPPVQRDSSTPQPSPSAYRADVDPPHAADPGDWPCSRELHRRRQASPGSSTDPYGTKVSPGRTDTQHTVGRTSVPDRDATRARRKRSFTKTSVNGPEEHLDGSRTSVSAQDNSDPEDEPSSSSSSSDSESDGLSLSSAGFDSDDGCPTRSEEQDFRPRPKGFIVSARGHPHTNNLKKDDPIAKYFQYQKYWELFPCPGTRDRTEVRMEIREKLAYQPPPPRPQRGVLVPNNYVVPTSKKRSAVRWDVRCDLANFLMPIPTFPSELLF